MVADIEFFNIRHVQLKKKNSQFLLRMYLIKHKNDESYYISTIKLRLKNVLCDKREGHISHFCYTLK